MLNKDYLQISYCITKDKVHYVVNETDLPSNLIMDCKEWFTPYEGHLYFKKDEMTEKEAIEYIKHKIIDIFEDQIHSIYDKISIVSKSLIT